MLLLFRRKSRPESSANRAIVRGPLGTWNDLVVLPRWKYCVPNPNLDKDATWQRATFLSCVRIFVTKKAVTLTVDQVCECGGVDIFGGTTVDVTCNGHTSHIGSDLRNLNTVSTGSQSAYSLYRYPDPDPDPDPRPDTGIVDRTSYVWAYGYWYGSSVTRYMVIPKC